MKVRAINDKRLFKFNRENGCNKVTVRFIPDKKGSKVKSYRKLARKNGDRVYVGWISQTNDTGKNPFYEKWERLYKAGYKEEAIIYSSSIRRVANVIVLNDEVTPSNNGKTFILDMGTTLYSQVENNILNSSVPEFKEWSFKDGAVTIEQYTGADRLIHFSTSSFNGEVNPRAIDLKFHDLSEGFLKSYEELVDDLGWYAEGDIARYEKVQKDKEAKAALEAQDNEVERCSI